MSLIVVIGGAGGIGEQLCAQLSSDGHSVLVCGRDAEKASACAARNGQTSLQIDARLEADMERLVAYLGERGEALSGAVNLAGSILIKAIERTSFAEWHETLATNLDTAFLTVKHLAPLMARGGGGSLVLMSSVAAQFGLSNHEAIAAAKAGVQGLVLSAAASFAGKGVRINAIAPGLVATPLSRGLISSDEARKASSAMHPLGRIGEPTDIANFISFLLQPQNSWITGQIFSVDGGMSSVKSRR